MAQPIILKKDADQETIETYGGNICNGIEANPTDFDTPTPKIADVRLAITDYTGSIKAPKDQSLATDKITNDKRMFAIKMVNDLIAWAYAKVNKNEEKLSDANIKFPKPPVKKGLIKLEVTNSRMGTAKGEFFFRFGDKGGADLIGAFRKMENGEFHIVDAFGQKYFTLEDQPSGEQTYIFKAKIKDEWGPESNKFTVHIP